MQGIWKGSPHALCDAPVTVLWDITEDDNGVTHYYDRGLKILWDCGRAGIITDNIPWSLIWDFVGDWIDETDNDKRNRVWGIIKAAGEAVIVRK